MHKKIVAVIICVIFMSGFQAHLSWPANSSSTGNAAAPMAEPSGWYYTANGKINFYMQDSKLNGDYYNNADQKENFKIIASRSGAVYDGRWHCLSLPSKGRVTIAGRSATQIMVTLFYDDGRGAASIPCEKR